MRFYTLLLLLCISFSGFSENSKKANRWIEKEIKSMTLDEKIGQLFMIAIYSNKGQEYEDQILETIRKYHLGGLIFFQGTPTQQVNIINRYRQAAPCPLLVGLDAEHGAGWRLQSAMEFPRMLTCGAVANDSLIYRLGATIARHCRTLGVHVNFAPVTDINNNPANPVIGTRSFGEDRENVFRKNRMYILGSLSENVLPVAKHFPGHGDTDTDSHHALPSINHSRRHLDSIELYPYKKLIQADALPAIMVSHLNVNALEPGGMPATLSPAIVKQLLKKELKFDGICFTDAMNMKGVTLGREKGDADLAALLAGNDVILFPEDVEAAISAVKQAVKKGVIKKRDIDEKCKKIWQIKQQYVLPDTFPLNTEKLWSRLNEPEDIALKQELYKQAVTLVKNADDLLPLKRLDSLKIASVNFGSGNINNFQTTLSRYADVKHLTLKEKANKQQLDSLIRQLSGFNCVILYNHAANNRSAKKFGYSPQLTQILRELNGKRVILCQPAIPYGLTDYMESVDAALVSYEDHLYAQQYAAQAVFGGIPTCGQLPVSISEKYPAGWGIRTEQTRLGYIMPEMLGISSLTLSRIDSICRYAIEIQATPGCQVLVAKDNYVIYNKAFGHNTYEQKTANHTENIYDMASVTKIAATMPAVMKLYDEGRIDLDASLSDYYPELKNSNKDNMTLREVLAHNAGLKASIPFFSNFIDERSSRGPLLSNSQSRRHTLKLRERLYANPEYQFKEKTVARKPMPRYSELTPYLYIYETFRDSILVRIVQSDLRAKKDYAYSDLGFILIQKALEQITQTSLDRYGKTQIFRKLGAYRTDFIAAQRLNINHVIPSSVDELYRKHEIKGYVHDPIATLMGGVAGHAGLFSTAEDIAKIMALYLNLGSYGGEYYFSPFTVKLFTGKADCFPGNRRGLGFDKPELDSSKISPVCEYTPASSFGHSGFTGTCAWGDPENQLIYIFLSNRTYPNEFNTKLNDENIRTNIQRIVYEAIEEAEKK